RQAAGRGGGRWRPVPVGPGQRPLLAALARVRDREEGSHERGHREKWLAKPVPGGLFARRQGGGRGRRGVGGLLMGGADRAKTPDYPAERRKGPGDRGCFFPGWKTPGHGKQWPDH